MLQLDLDTTSRRIALCNHKRAGSKAAWAETDNLQVVSRYPCTPNLQNSSLTMRKQRILASMTHLHMTLTKTGTKCAALNRQTRTWREFMWAGPHTDPDSPSDKIIPGTYIVSDLIQPTDFAQWHKIFLQIIHTKKLME